MTRATQYHPDYDRPTALRHNRRLGLRLRDHAGDGPLGRGGAFLPQCLLPGCDLHCLASGDFHGYVPAQYRRVQL